MEPLGHRWRRNVVLVDRLGDGFGRARTAVAFQGVRSGRSIEDLPRRRNQRVTDIWTLNGLADRPVGLALVSSTAGQDEFLASVAPLPDIVFRRWPDWRSDRNSTERETLSRKAAKPQRGVGILRYPLLRFSRGLRCLGPGVAGRSARRVPRRWSKPEFPEYVSVGNSRRGLVTCAIDPR